MVEVQGYAHRARRELARGAPPPRRRRRRPTRSTRRPRSCAGSSATATGSRAPRAVRATSRSPWTARSAGWTASPPTWGTCCGATSPRRRRPRRSPRTWRARRWPAAGACGPSRARMAGFNPISYHVGSVWPHDTALACEGLRRYGLDAAALALAADLISAMALFDHRLPELFGGHAREPGDTPTPYPTACRPQAWAAGSRSSSRPCSSASSRTCRPAGSGSRRPAARARRARGAGDLLPGGPLSVRVDRRGDPGPPGARRTSSSSCARRGESAPRMPGAPPGAARILGPVDDARLARAFFGATSLIVTFGLILQLGLSITAGSDEGYFPFDARPDRQLLHYFTVLSNIAVAATTGLLAIRLHRRSVLFRTLRAGARQPGGARQRRARRRPVPRHLRWNLALDRRLRGVRAEEQ